MWQDPEHWLWRLRSDEWLAAAQVELAQARGSFDDRRRCLVHLRRSAGMAINGFLVACRDQGAAADQCESSLGRSYVEHLAALRDPSQIRPLHESLRMSSAPQAIRDKLLAWPEAATREATDKLLAIPTVANAARLVQLGRHRHAELEDAVALCGRVLDSIEQLITAVNAE